MILFLALLTVTPDLGRTFCLGKNPTSLTLIKDHQSGILQIWIILEIYAEIGYFGRLKLFPFQDLTRVHFSLFSENNGLLNIYMLK